jgi:hypothetical protein
MQRRERSVTAREPSQGAQSSDASSRSQWGVTDYVVHFISLMLLFGVIGFLFSSWFPIALGLFLFVTDDGFLQWVFWKVGIQLVPDTLGPEFIKAFVFLFGLWTLLAYWSDSAPAWLLPWIPPTASWYFIGGAAFGCAVLKIISVAVVRRLLPRVGIEITPGRQGWAILVVLGMLIGLMMLTLLFFTS